MPEVNSAEFRPIEFRSEILRPRILMRDSSGDLTEKTVPIEIRWDPLTGQTCRLLDYSLDRILRPDLEGIVQRSLELGCPFCAPGVEEITPRFPAELVPEGVLRRGEAMVFPNARPYDIYSAIVVVSREHFVPLAEFTLETLFDALMVALAYLKRVQKVEPRAEHHFIAWNYMPPSGGSLIHPHIQCNIGYFPTFYQRQILDASLRYYEKTGANFWSDLIGQEKQVGQRYIAAGGNIHWLTSFAPRGRLPDVLAIFQGKASITEPSEDDLRDLAAGLLKVFRYLDKLNLVSFNLSTYSGTDANQFWAHVRVMPRSLLLYSPIETSDQFYYHVMHDEGICLLPPETACESLKSYFTS